MAINIGLVIIILIGGVVFGIAIAGLITLGKLVYLQFKTKSQWKNKKGIFENKTTGLPSEAVIDLRQTPNQEPLPPVPAPIQVQTKESTYEEDLKKFQEANKELEKFLKLYNEGKILYEELKEKFNHYQSQPYYIRISKDYGEKR